MKSILIVEDAHDLAQAIQRELESAGYETILAEDGEKALEMYSQHKPDLIILDWMLPGLDGLTVLRRIREDSPVPVLMLTAKGEEADRVLGLEVGADDYLTKPVSLRELVARVRTLFRRLEHMEQILLQDRTGASEVLKYGMLTLDPEGYQTKVAGEPIDLSRTEFELLHLMLRNQGRAFSRAYLLEAVWGEAFIEGDRSVDNAVLRLRRKLEPLGDVIETVWGVGYRLRREVE